MWKLKIKPAKDEAIKKEFDTLQEVAEWIKKFCDSSNLADFLAVQKEFNVRFYISRINKAN